ncbi:MAG: hypothetical protein ACRDWY_08205, partial [Actinomycetes bacterium]
ATPGLISLPAVVPGVEYTITEVSAPDGWIKDGSVVKKTPVPFGTSQGQSNTASFTNHRGSVTFYKEYDGSDPSPTGASFTLTRDGDDADSAYDDGTVNVTDNGAGDDAPAIGVIMVDPLDAGSWKLVEDVGGAPTGWIRDGDEVLFTVPDAMGNRNVTLANPTLSDPRRTYPLEVHKVGVVPGRSDVDVEGTVFRLWRDSDGIAGLNRGTDTDAGSCQTGANGTCSVTGQAWGFDYFWEEVSVPAPWNLPNDRVVGPVHLNADGSTVPSGVSEFEDPRSAIETSATNGALPGGQIGDSATLTGIRGDAGGSITFRLWDNVACAGQPIFVSDPVAVDGPGTYGPVTTTVTGAGDYYWIATYSGDPNTGTRGVSGDCGDEGETSTVVRARPGITTVVPDSDVDLSDAVTQLTDNATLTGASATATGSISFTLYGPFGSDPVPGDCTGDKAVSTVGAARAFSGNGTYTSEPVTVGQAGIYTWKATYVSGDSNNDDATHPCGEESETVDVDKAEPTITTEAEQDEVSLGGLPTTLTDKAVLRGATTTATGSVTFSLYGPFANDPGPGSCTAGKLVRTVGSVQAFTGNRTYTSMPVVVDEVGYYTWVATYGGDGDNKSATHACGQAEETTRVNPARPTITTTAGDDQVIGPDGSTLTDTASLRGATSDATGRITFRLYGPFASDPTGEDGACVAGTLVDTVENDEVDGNDDYVSPGVSVKETGYYVWVATYGGDANNLSATHACGDASEVVRVRPRQPVITTEVPDRVVTLGPNGISLHDTATLSNATSAAGGTISFQLYGPFASAPTAESCADGAKAGAPLGTTAPVSGNGTYTSLSTKVTAAGYYTWIATYSGDANNRSATHPCGLETETVLVEKAPTGVTTVATTSAVIKLGQTISDAASVTGLTAAATGTVTFTLYGPGDTTCTGTPVFTSTVPLVVTLDSGGTGTGTATSEAYKPTTAGTYRWVAGYSGDGNNASSAGKCNDPNEQSVVRAGDNPNLDKASDPASGSAVQPGSTINYSVRVWNTGDVAITDADVVDILPPHVTVKESSISDGGVISADRTRITWKVTLAPADPSGTSDEKTLTYAVTVNRDAPEGAVLLNTARFLGLEDTTTHVVPTGDLTIVKEVSPVAGNGVVVEFGDKLTYTLSVHATGTLNQPDVVVTDYLPGLDPARPESGETTYVAGSATCTGAGACAVTEPGADGLVTWALGEMAAGTTRQVSFQVVIVDIPGEEGETVVADIYNTGAVQSSRTPKVRSNEVVTPVSKVLPVKAGQPPKELPRTGLPLPTRPLVGVALALLGVGLALVLLAAGGRPRGMHRISAR